MKKEGRIVSIDRPIGSSDLDIIIHNMIIRYVEIDYELSKHINIGDIVHLKPNKDVNTPIIYEAGNGCTEDDADYANGYLYRNAMLIIGKAWVCNGISFTVKVVTKEDNLHVVDYPIDNYRIRNNI